MVDKSFWFKIKGRIYAPDYDSAREQAKSFCEAGRNCERAFIEVEEDKE